MSTLAESLGLVPESDLCSMLNIKLATAANRRSLGQMPPHVKIGQAIFYERDELRAWLARNERRPEAPRGPGRPRRTAS